MSTSIHASIEYTTTWSPATVMSFAEVSPGTSFSDIFEALGCGASEDSVVPIRGFPRNGEYVGDIGWVASRQLTCLVVNSFAPDTREQEGDGLCVSADIARGWIARGISEVLPEAHGWAEVGGGGGTSEYWRVRNPDIHDVNWITADELEKAIEVAGTGHLAGYRAAVAAMRVLEADDHVAMVRFIYGFDN